MIRAKRLLIATLVTLAILMWLGGLKAIVGALFIVSIVLLGLSFIVFWVWAFTGKWDSLF